MTLDIRAIQARLKELGFDPGPIDGIRGRMTDAAIVEFKRSVNLRPRSYVGPITLGKLFAGTSEYVRPGGVDMPWFDEAERLRGLREGPDAANNQTILDWADDLEISYPADSIAWCGLFVAHCVASTLPAEPLPTNPLGARNWLSFGVKTTPQKGAVLVFWRGSRSGWQGHVGFYAGEDGAAYHVLGGNQADSVNVARVAKSRLLGARWPKTFQPGSGETVRGAVAGALSTNEA